MLPVQQAGVTIDSGSFEDGKIEYQGMEISVVPLANGQIDVDLEAPQKENALNTMDDLIAGLTNPNLTQNEFEQVLADAIVQLDNAKNKVSLVQAGLGGRLNTAKKIEQSNSDLDVSNKAAKSELVELDMAEAITELTKQETSLQAAQATFGRLANFSLFDYL